jgi:hypothetical protein
MQKYSDIHKFTQQIMRFVGNGYKYIQISQIPEKKQHKKNKILSKLESKYNTNLSVWQRQYRRRKNLANFVALNYDNTIVILKTNGETELNEKFEDVLNSVIAFNTLQLVIYKDERNKLTFRLSKELFRNIKAKIQLSLKNKRQKDFQNEITKLYNLHRKLPYRGLMLQISTLLRDIKKLQKQYNTNYKVPTFFK